MYAEVHGHPSVIKGEISRTITVAVIVLPTEALHRGLHRDESDRHDARNGTELARRTLFRYVCAGIVQGVWV